MLEKIGPTTKSTLSRSSRPLTFGDGGVRLEFVVDHHEFNVAAGHLAAEIPDREREAVAGLLAEPRGRAGQGHDHADLDPLLRECRIGGHAQQNRQAGQPQLLLHDCSPDRRLVRSRNDADTIRAFKT
jgi:hypothetical protein